MAIYLDPLCNHGWVMYGRRVMSSHLFTDGDPEELHAFAQRIGLKRRWAQVSKIGVLHYDVIASKYDRALEAGAIPLNRKETVEVWKKKRDFVEGVAPRSSGS